MCATLWRPGGLHFSWIVRGNWKIYADRKPRETVHNLSRFQSWSSCANQFRILILRKLSWEQRFTAVPNKTNCPVFDHLSGGSGLARLWFLIVNKADKMGCSSSVADSWHQIQWPSDLTRHNSVLFVCEWSTISPALRSILFSCPEMKYWHVFCPTLVENESTWEQYWIVEANERYP